MNVPGVEILCKRLAIRISFYCKRLLVQIGSKIDVSGNIYESGKICSSVNLVLEYNVTEQEEKKLRNIKLKVSGSYNVS